MTKKEFWSIIEKAQGIDTKLEEILVSINDLDEVLKFEYIFHDLSKDIYNEEMWFMCRVLMKGRCSDSCMRGFMNWLISQGEKVYTEAINNPDSLVDKYKPSNNHEYNYETFLYAVMNASAIIAGETGLCYSKEFMHYRDKFFADMNKDREVKKYGKPDLKVWNSKEFQDKFPKAIKYLR